MTSTETLPCQGCKRPFHIQPEDREFYQHIEVPSPTFCAECRLKRRLAFRNERSLYKRICALCNSSVISMYSPDKDFMVLCPDCFYSDRWDPMSYGRPYDAQKNFFEQWLSLNETIPHLSLLQTNSTNSPWVNYELDAKNCYLNIGGHLNEDSAYNQYALKSRDCFDNYWVHQGEFCYESTLCERAYKVWFSTLCFDCRDTYFSFDCRNCSNVIGCSGLRYKQYYIFNKPVTKEEYERTLKEMNFGSYEALQQVRNKTHELWKSAPQRGVFIEQSVNSTGHIIRECKNCQECFFVDRSEDFKNGLLCIQVRDSMDVTSVWQGELLYEFMGGAEHLANICFSTGILRSSTNIEYSHLLSNCHHCFGCINLRDKSYCIFNRQYDRDEYFHLVAKIRNHMSDMPFIDRNGAVYKYGEFFPYELSPFEYHETVAQEYFPAEKIPVAEQSYAFTDYQIPDDIEDVEDDILEQILKCEVSGKAYRIIPLELVFYRRFELPVPRRAPFERHRHRLGFVSNHRQSYIRKCSKCFQDTASVYLKSEFSRIYCEKCYAKQVL